MSRKYRSGSIEFSLCCMRMILIGLTASACLIAEGFSQTAQEAETDFIRLKQYTVSVGITVNYSDTTNGQIYKKNRFSVIGSGLITYTKLRDSIIINTIVTAGHVVKYFLDNKLPNIYIRPSWADTIKTSEYQGISIPLFNPDKTPNTYLYPDPKIDLAGIILLPVYFNDVFKEYLNTSKNPVFPIASMTNPYVGNQVWVLGYPGHIENQLREYAICTVKPGYIAWRPNVGMTNVDLKHITIIESNASFGNSGGPVFSFQERTELIGILTGGYLEREPLSMNGHPVIDPATKQQLLIEVRSGVSIVEKAEYVRRLISYIQDQFKKYQKPQK